MRIFSRVLDVIVSAIMMLIGFAFVFIEGCLLFTGDFLLFESPALAFIQTILRLLLALGVFALGLFAVIKKNRDFLTEGLASLACAFIMAPFLTNGFGLYFILIAVLFTLTNLFYRYTAQK